MKKFYPIALVIVGLIGVFATKSIIIFDGGLFAEMNLPESSYKNDAGETLYGFYQIHEFIIDYAQSRAGWWALDVLAVYLLFHGFVSILLHNQELRLWFKTKSDLWSMFWRSILTVVLGVSFWFLMAQVIFILDMPLH